MALKITITRSEPLKSAADLVLIGVAEGASRRSGVLRELSKAIGPSFNKILKRAEFSGKKDQAVGIGTGGALKALRIALVGLGDPAKLDYAAVRRMAARGARLAVGANATTMAIELPRDGEGNYLPGVARAAAEGAVLGAYRFEEFKTGDRLSKYPLARVSLLTSDKATPALREQVELGHRVGESVCIARDLINTPSNELYPEALASYAKQLCKNNGMSCTVLDETALRKKGMNLMLAVGQGSVRGPRLVHMKYRPKTTRQLKKLVFVGKGITFDTGGICLKPGPGMDEMKGDMGGAANVVALMAVVAALQPDAEVHGIIACAENMPDGKAYRPGDIFRSYKGKTVEIINTDAEGRLVLADALAYAAELEPDFILDNATLTGACVVALGPNVSAYYSNQNDMATLIGDAAKEAGEPMWHMPLVDEYREMLKSEWADLKHMGERWGGSITAALFLKEFIGEVPWVHVDIAGPSMLSKAWDIYSKGGTGHGVLTFMKIIDMMSAPSPDDSQDDAGD